MELHCPFLLNDSRMTILWALPSQGNGLERTDSIDPLMVTSSIWHTCCRISSQVGAWRHTRSYKDNVSIHYFNVTYMCTIARICQQCVNYLWDSVALSNENALFHNYTWLFGWTFSLTLHFKQWVYTILKGGPQVCIAWTKNTRQISLWDNKVP